MKINTPQLELNIQEENIDKARKICTHLIQSAIHDLVAMELLIFLLYEHLVTLRVAGACWI